MCEVLNKKIMENSAFLQQPHINHFTHSATTPNANGFITKEDIKLSYIIYESQSSSNRPENFHSEAGALLSVQLKSTRRR